MRIGNNPHKDEEIPQSEYMHQVVIPVYIPNQDGYFKDSIRILQICLQSLFKTVHEKTYITIVNNGSGEIVKDYLDQLYLEGKIHELIHTENIGKVNAILKGLAGNNIELVTITDADVLFLDYWQLETARVFNVFPKAGVVGIVPQFNMFKSMCGNVIFDNLFSEKLKFIKVNSPEGLISFYDSIGWDRTYNKDYLKYALGLENEKCTVYIGSGHFVATYKKHFFQEIKSYLNYKLGGDSENYLDILPLQYDNWRVTTQDNYAYHMGNVYEDWMGEIIHKKYIDDPVSFHFNIHKRANPFIVLLKNRIFPKILFNNLILKFFYYWKKLPKLMIDNYNNIIPK